MTQSGSDEDRHISLGAPDLFPRIETPVGPVGRESSVEEVSFDITDGGSSIRHFRKVFSKHQDDSEFDGDIDDSRVFELSLQCSSDTECGHSALDGISLHSSIIDQISALSGGADDRFKYLSAYMQLQDKKLQDDRNSGKDGPGVSLAGMDDYNRYLRLTELDNIIRAKVQQKSKQSNILSTVPEKELAENFYHDNASEIKWDLHLQKKRFGRKWKHLGKKRTPGVSFDLEYDEDDSGGEKRPQYLQRKLKIRHLQMISFGGTLGVGLFLNSGKALTIAGPFGMLLAYVLCGAVVLATIVSFAEMATFVSVIDGVSGLSSRFVNDSFGFAAGWLYFFSFAFGISGEVVASIIMLSYYPDLKVLDNNGTAAGFVTLFLGMIIISNLIDVRVFGELEYISSLIKLFGVLVIMIFMIVLNRGGFGNDTIGFKFWRHLQSDFEHHLIFGLFRPSFNLHDTGVDTGDVGIAGDAGRFLSFLTALTITAYAYSGTEIVCIAACEAKNPRKALPSALKRVFWRILFFYCLSAFLVSLNVYAGDPRLVRYYLGLTGVNLNDFNTNYAIKYVGGVNCILNDYIYAGFATGAQSPWIVALLSAGLCKLSSVVNGFLVFFAISCGNAQLYVCSRTIYSLALQKKAPRFLTICNRNGIPYWAVLFSASFGLLSYICVSESALVVFQNLTSVISASGIMVWFAMCLSFIRFFYGLKLRPDIISRNDKAYPYKSPFQPYTAIFGLFGSSTILLAMGYVVFLKGEWDTMFFFSSYGALFVFVFLYLAYRLIKGTKTPSLETIDFDSGRSEVDRIIWDGGKDYNSRDFKDVSKRWISFLS